MNNVHKRIGTRKIYYWYPLKKEKESFNCSNEEGMMHFSVIQAFSLLVDTNNFYYFFSFRVKKIRG